MTGGRPRILPLVFALSRSLLSFAATLAGAALLVQLLLWLAPGDAADLLASDPETRAAMVQRWGLDQPVLVRYGRFVVNALQGDLGVSLTYRPGAAVGQLVWQGATQSGPLLLIALFSTLMTGVGLAYARVQRVHMARRLVQAVSVAPVFLLAYVLMVGLNEATFALWEAERIARPAWFALPDEDSLVKTALAIGVLAVGSSSLAEVQAACEDELGAIRASGYVDAARARGAALWPHVLLNLIPPLSTIAATRTAFFMGGLIVVETVLHLNGAGAMLWQACRMRDYPLALGLTVAAAAVVCAARLMGDVVRVSVDPRLRSIS